jgi:nuclear mRNA export protein SAC3
VSLNPKNDATAVWVEKKLNVPESGEWISEAVFAIREQDEEFSCPGLIFFECTPLEGQDEIERSDFSSMWHCICLWELWCRKYRILDDCSRLRDIVESLPKQRRYLPSLFLLAWGDPGAADLQPDLKSMVHSSIPSILLYVDRRFQIDTWEEEGVFASYATLALNDATKNVDGKFADVLKSLALDVQGERMAPFTFKGTLHLLFRPLVI